MTVEIIASSGGRIRRLHYRCTARHEARSGINSDAFDHTKMTLEPPSCERAVFSRHYVREKRPHGVLYYVRNTR